MREIFVEDFLSFHFTLLSAGMAYPDLMLEVILEAMK